MRLQRFLTLAFLSFLLIGGVSANGQEIERAAIKTKDGALLVWNQPNNYFTLEILGKEVLPNNSTDHVFFRVDGMVLQIQVALFSQFLKDDGKSGHNPQQILNAHRDWEAQYVEGLFKRKLTTQSSPLKLKSGNEALFWHFDMPEGVNKEAKKQLFLTTVNGEHVIVLNGVVTDKVKEESVRQLLVKTLETLKVSSKPFDLQELQEAIRRGNSQ